MTVTRAVAAEAEAKVDLFGQGDSDVKVQTRETAAAQTQGRHTATCPLPLALSTSVQRRGPGKVQEALQGCAPLVMNHKTALKLHLTCAVPCPLFVSRKQVWKTKSFAAVPTPPPATVTREKYSEWQEATVVRFTVDRQRFDVADIFTEKVTTVPRKRVRKRGSDRAL